MDTRVCGSSSTGFASSTPALASAGLVVGNDLVAEFSTILDTFVRPEYLPRSRDRVGKRTAIICARSVTEHASEHLVCNEARRRPEHLKHPVFLADTVWHG